MTIRTIENNEGDSEIYGVSYLANELAPAETWASLLKRAQTELSAYRRDDMAIDHLHVVHSDGVVHHARVGANSVDFDAAHRFILDALIPSVKAISLDVDHP